ncbi:MAG: hypothetical protein ACOYJC_05380 [Christensenellales bacterium]
MMADNGEKVLRIDWFSGIDRSVDDANLPLHAAHHAVNFDTSKGNLRVACGYTKAFEQEVEGAQPLRCRYLIPYYMRDTTQGLMVMAREGEGLGAEQALFYRQDGTDVWTRLGMDIGMNERLYSFVNYQWDAYAIVLMADGSWLKYWDGQSGAIKRIETEYAAMGLRYIAVGNERVWGAGSLANPDRVYYSKAYNPLDWRSNEPAPDANGGYIDLPSWEKGGRIIGICEMFGDMIVFKENDIFRIYGAVPSQFQVARLSGVEGPVNNRTIVKHGNMIYYLAKNGLYVYDGTRAYLLEVSAKADYAWRYLDYDVNGLAHICVHRDQIFISLPGEKAVVQGGVTTMQVQDHGRLLVYDIRKNTFMERTGFDAYSFLEYKRTGDGQHKDVLFFARQDGFVYELNEGVCVYDGQPIPAYWETPWMDFKKKDAVKTLEVVYAFGRGEENALLVVDVITDRKGKQKVMRLHEDGGVLRIFVRARGRRIKLRFANYREQKGDLHAIEPKYIEIMGGILMRLEADED